MDLMVKRILNSPIDSNCYVIFRIGYPNCIIIDPGTADSMNLLNFLKLNCLNPDYIFLTHEHFDHIWGVNLIKDLYLSRIVCSKLCSENIVNKKKNMSLFYDQVGFITHPADIITEDTGFKIMWNDTEFEFIESPGHTDSSICIAVNNCLFTGDTIIKNQKTVVKFPGGNKEKLKQTLASLSHRFEYKSVQVYPGHGEIFSMDEICIEQLI